MASAGGIHGKAGEAVLWDLSTQTERMRLPELSDLVANVRFAPDGATLATAGYDKTVKLWDTATGKVRTTFRGENPVIGVAFSADGELAASASFQERVVHLWNANTGTEQWTLPGLPPVTFSPTKHMVVTCTDQYQAILWDLSTRTERCRFGGHAHLITAMAFSGDGRLLATAS
ncbi:MAG TPA: hypothetical protein VG099_19710, partial [Gemmataceae bacterium]|nr:hypothetical protein [Gemmataceae bacterium]